MTAAASSSVGGPAAARGGSCRPPLNLPGSSKLIKPTKKHAHSSKAPASESNTRRLREADAKFVSRTCEDGWNKSVSGDSSDGLHDTETFSLTDCSHQFWSASLPSPPAEADHHHAHAVQHTVKTDLNQQADKTAVVTTTMNPPSTSESSSQTLRNAEMDIIINRIGRIEAKQTEVLAELEALKLELMKKYES